jgi:hypothetical protein
MMSQIIVSESEKRQEEMIWDIYKGALRISMRAAFVVASSWVSIS